MGLIGNRLTQLRKKKHLTQQQLADLIPTNRVNVTRWENETTEPNLDTLILLTRILDTSADYLLGIKNIFQNDSNIER